MTIRTYFSRKNPFIKSKLKARAIIAVLICFAAFSQTVQAASEDECAIWICLPGGFPSGCGGALSAMKDRIKKFQPPLPSFDSCTVNSPPSKMSYDYNYAALMNTNPPSYRKGTFCQKDAYGRSNPRGCIATYRYIDVFLDGKQAGETYYWNP